MYIHAYINIHKMYEKYIDLHKTRAKEQTYPTNQLTSHTNKIIPKNQKINSYRPKTKIS